MSGFVPWRGSSAIRSGTDAGRGPATHCRGLCGGSGVVRRCGLDQLHEYVVLGEGGQRERLESVTVSKKSQASRTSAWGRRNWAQVLDVRRGAGSMPASVRNCRFQPRPAYRPGRPPKQIIERIRAYEDAGVDLMLLQFSPQLEEWPGSAGR